MEDISLHILDIIENSINAHCTQVDVKIIEDVERDILRIDIVDDGEGMDRGTLAKARDPFWTTKAGKRIGLGLPLLAQAAREGGGDIKIKSEPHKGTKISATFKLSHPDTKPLGNIKKTLWVLEKTHPDITFTFNCLKL